MARYVKPHFFCNLASSALTSPDGLLIVDLCNDLLSEDGELCRSTLDASNVVEHLRQVLDAARSNGILVFITPHHHWWKVVDVDVTPPRLIGLVAGARCSQWTHA